MGAVVAVEPDFGADRVMGARSLRWTDSDKGELD
jgi:hypothetical protein